VSKVWESNLFSFPSPPSPKLLVSGSLLASVQLARSWNLNERNKWQKYLFLLTVFYTHLGCWSYLPGNTKINPFRTKFMKQQKSHCTISVWYTKYFVPGAWQANNIFVFCWCGALTLTGRQGPTEASLTLPFLSWTGEREDNKKLLGWDKDKEITRQLPP